MLVSLQLRLLKTRSSPNSHFRRPIGHRISPPSGHQPKRPSTASGLPGEAGHISGAQVSGSISRVKALPY